MKKFLTVILVLVAVITGLYAVFGLGYGIFGTILALTSTGGGFVGEEDFYRSALLLVSLVMLLTGGLAGVISYVCWTRYRRRRSV